MVRGRRNYSKEDTRVWDGLNALSRETRQLLSAVSNIEGLVCRVQSSLAARDEFSRRLDVRTFGAKAQQLTRDITRFKDEFDAIHAKHKDRSGEESDPDQWLKCIQIGEEYIDWSQRFETIVIPSYQSMVNMAAAAEGQSEVVNLGGFSGAEEPNQL